MSRLFKLNSPYLINNLRGENNFRWIFRVRLTFMVPHFGYINTYNYPFGRCARELRRVGKLALTITIRITKLTHTHAHTDTHTLTPHKARRQERTRTHTFGAESSTARSLLSLVTVLPARRDFCARWFKRPARKPRRSAHFLFESSGRDGSCASELVRKEGEPSRVFDMWTNTVGVFSRIEVTLTRMIHNFYYQKFKSTSQLCSIVQGLDYLF